MSWNFHPSLTTKTHVTALFMILFQNTYKDLVRRSKDFSTHFKSFGRNSQLSIFLMENHTTTLTLSWLMPNFCFIGSVFRRYITVRNIENDPLIEDNTAKQRACHFHSENEGGVYPHYSYSACTVQCRKKGQMDQCGCTDHFMVGTSKICSP